MPEPDSDKLDFVEMFRSELRSLQELLNGTTDGIQAHAIVEAQLNIVSHWDTIQTASSIFTASRK